MNENHKVTLSASLRVSGETLDPSLVTSALDMVPSSAARKGEVLRSRGNQKLMANTGIWFATIWEQRFGIEEIISYPQSTVHQYIEKLQGLQGIEAVELSFLLNSGSDNVIQFFKNNSGVLSSFVSDQAQFMVGNARAETDLEIATTGNCWLIRPGQKISLTVQMVGAQPCWQENISAYTK